ncbi:HAD family hydrolase [Weissella paramesenteroides]|uniref:HAD family hydrolase n=1 Tax=Weissella paramesenteroides TaxID=1249 RepID=UPI003F2670F0
MIKQIFLDMDGTLLDARGLLTKNTITAIKNSQIPVTLVSARAPQEMIFAIHDLALDAPQVAFNGGLIYQMNGTEMQVLQAYPIEQMVSIKLINWLASTYPEVSLSYYTQDSWLVDHASTAIDREILFTGMKPQYSDLSEVTQNSQTGIFKIMLIDLSETQLDFMQQAILNLELPGINVQQSDASHLEITSDIAKKAFGVSHIIAREQLSQVETAAFGDGQNDLSMFYEVGTSIAMGNAPTNVKQSANYVTKTNTAEGVAYGIEKFLLNQP